jgi:hypothetical protein
MQRGFRRKINGRDGPIGTVVNMLNLNPETRVLLPTIGRALWVKKFSVNVQLEEILFQKDMSKRIQFWLPLMNILAIMSFRIAITFH